MFRCLFLDKILLVTNLRIQVQELISYKPRKKEDSIEDYYGLSSVSLPELTFPPFYAVIKKSSIRSQTQHTRNGEEKRH